MARLKFGGCIFVFKSNIETPFNQIKQLRDNLSKLAKNSKFWLLHIKTSKDHKYWGSIEVTDGNIITGWIDKFAEYNTANDFSPTHWRSILDATLNATLYENWELSELQVETEISNKFKRLYFPLGTDNHTYYSEDRGLVELTSSNSWSRRIESKFRLHASRSASSPSTLKWSDIPLQSKGCILYFSGALSVAYSMPVSIIFKVYCDNKIVDLWLSEISTLGATREVSIPQGFKFLSIELQAIRLLDLKDNEVAAVDIEPLEITYL